MDALRSEGVTTLSGREVTAIDAEVGRRIKQEREKAGLSQTALGVRVGISFQQVQKYETGRNRLTMGRVVHFAAALGIPLLIFWDGLDELGPPKSGLKPKRKRRKRK